ILNVKGANKYTKDIFVAYCRFVFYFLNKFLFYP
ncbi:hypothetical protein TNCT_191481, partial [Trichonephila clavata]